MKSVRIGNDIHIKWSLLNKGEQFFLEGKDVTIYQSCKYETRKITNFSISGSTVTWTFFGKEQKYTGTYSVELVVNEGKENMITTDARKFVNLIPHCCDTEDSDEQDFVVESICLKTEVKFVSMLIDDILSDKSDNAISNRAVTNALNAKQDTLISGDNIKTINGQSLLGNGNIEIQGGSGGGSTDPELLEAYIPIQRQFSDDFNNDFAR